MNDAPAASQRSSVAKMLLFGILGVVAIVSGVAQMMGGFGELFGWGDNAKISHLLEEADAAAGVGESHATAGDEQLQKLIEAIQSQGYAAARGELRPAAELAATELSAAAEQLRLAGAKLAEVLTLDITDEGRKYLEPRAEAFAKFAEAYGARRDAVMALLDEELDEAALATKVEELLTKSGEVFGQANELMQKSNDLAPENN